MFSVYIGEEVVRLREERLEQWIAQYADAILRTCFIYLTDKTQAEDALQDTFLKAWQHMEQFESRDSCDVKSWLMRIAINTCHDYHRSKWFRHVDMTKQLNELTGRDVTVLPEDQSLLIDVSKLSEKYKQVVLLYFYQEMTLQEAAEALGLGCSTVHKRLKKAQELLKGRLTGRDLGHGE